MADRYAGVGDDLLSPASDGAAVTPNDNTDLTTAAKRLWVGGAGNVALTTIRGTSLSYLGVPAGTYLFVRTARVLATGTTATNILAEF